VPLIALVFVLTSALLHATWNAIVKSGDDHLVAGWGTVSGAAITALPLAAVAGLPSPGALLFVGVSGVLHAFYNLTLIRAYDHGDLSLVYPVARGAAPALATAGAIVAYHEALPAVAYAGIALVTLGVLLLGAGGRHVPMSRQALVWSILTAACIATYTLVDRQGIRQTSAPSYIVGLFWINAVLLSVYVRVRRTAWPWRLVAPGRWGPLVLSGVFSLAAYLLVLLALSISRVGYIAALRETSVLIAAWVGWRHLGDLHGMPRFLSSAVVVVGLALLVAFR
jgi:uncharacterized membrane protein